jgi:hypothetical protein
MPPVSDLGLAIAAPIVLVSWTGVAIPVDFIENEVLTETPTDKILLLSYRGLGRP